MIFEAEVDFGKGDVMVRLVRILAQDSSVGRDLRFRRPAGFESRSGL